MSRNDKDTNVSLLKAQAKRFIDERNWKKYHSPKDLAIALNVEASELLDLFKWKDIDDKELKEISDEIREEFADVLIYLLYIANELSIDMTESVFEKLERDKEKYPVDDPNIENKW